ncbi:hypothetical protein HHI36_003970 [Cryptolaemus montrouzieri]|uniref:Doublecortin domain-containing protein n=1 Tax=Cryptolaemus montrouzieri TaxID=559131 RepID=A0ABD2NQF4_9CUCU
MSSDSHIKPKRLHVFVNGSSSERIFFVHPKCRLSWSSIINFIGDLLKPQNGPIRKLRRVDGVPVNSYEELEDNGKYIACGNEMLVPLREGYRTESEMKIQKELREASSSEILTAIDGDINYLTDTNQMKIISVYVFINGEKNKPKKISLLNTDLYHWTTILNIISKQLNASVKYLYTIFGEKLQHPSEIQHRGFYVALGDGTAFEDVSYLSVFSTKKQRKVRFKQTTQQTNYSDDPIFSNDMLSSEAAGSRKDNLSTPAELYNTTSNVSQESHLIHSYEFINANHPSTDSPCIHVTIVQRPFSATKHLPGVPATVCATNPSAKLIVEMMGQEEYHARCHICKSTQTSTIFCEAIPKGKCTIEVASKKFHIICDDDAIVLPCGTYFSSHKSMKNLCTFPVGNESLSLENIASHIVGIVVDTSEYCINRAIHGMDDTKINGLGSNKGEAEETDNTTLNCKYSTELKNEVQDSLLEREHEVSTR